MMRAACAVLLLVCGVCALAQDEDSSLKGQVVARLTRRDGETVVRLSADYGILLIWTDSEKKFCIFNNRDNATTVTKDFNEFLKKLSELPAGSEVERFDTCSISRAWKMSATKWKRLAAVMKEQQLKWAISKVNGTDTTLICTCEATSVSYPEAK